MKTIAWELKQEGELIGLREAVYDVLWARFEALPDSVQEQVAEINDPKLLRQTAVQAAVAETLADFMAWLAELANG